MTLDLIIPIWKPVDWTSFDVVKNIRNQIKPSKVGHAGSLDPFAEGVLMLCTGSKTKSIEAFMDQEKEYHAEIELGSETDTYDLTGKVVLTSHIPELNTKSINKILKYYTGQIMQEPPMYSALKYKGRPLYKLARQGITVQRRKRLINIYDIQLQEFSVNSIIITVICGRGTYIRSLAHDISQSLGTVGHLKRLKRTRIGDIDKQACIKVKEFPSWLSARA